MRSEATSHVPGGNDMKGKICFFAGGFAAATAGEFSSFCFCVGVSKRCAAAVRSDSSNLGWWLDSVDIVVLVDEVLIVGVVVLDSFARPSRSA